jgi:FkbM family methyltransferase
MILKRGNKQLKDFNIEKLEPASSGEAMKDFINWVKNYSALVPSNVFEVGANMAQDAKVLQDGFDLAENKIWTFEPHPVLDKYIKKHYKFNQFPYAVSDTDSNVEINFINPQKNSNTGISSLRKHLTVKEDDFIKASVPSVRLDTFIKENRIKTIDFLKLDVEGCNYEVLKGLGDKISIVQSLHIEAEHEEDWEGEKLWEDIKELLEPHFEMVFFQRYYTQSDSFWIKKKYLKGEPRPDEP